jgi:hypothetical protein
MERERKTALADTVQPATLMPSMDQAFIREEVARCPLYSRTQWWLQRL